MDAIGTAFSQLAVRASSANKAARKHVLQKKPAPKGWLAVKVTADALQHDPGLFAGHKLPQEAVEPDLASETAAWLVPQYPSGESHLSFPLKRLSSVLMDDLKVAHKYGG